VLLQTQVLRSSAKLFVVSLVVPLKKLKSLALTTSHTQTRGGPNLMLERFEEILLIFRLTPVIMPVHKRLCK
jgi:hypothetical protein